MELKLHPLRQNGLNVKSAHESTEICLRQNSYGDGITINLMSGKISKDGVERLNKTRIIENGYGLIDVHIFPQNVAIPGLKEDEKIIWSNF
jgi:hypothetical protein